MKYADIIDNSSLIKYIEMNTNPYRKLSSTHQNEKRYGRENKFISDILETCSIREHVDKMSGFGSNKCVCGNQVIFVESRKSFSKFCSQHCCRTTYKMDKETTTRITDMRTEKMKLISKTDEYRKKISIKSKEYMSQEHIREERSYNMKQKILKGEFTPKVTNSWTRWDVSINGKKFRSSFEALFYEYKVNFLGENYNYEKHRIPYRDCDGKDRIYIVDFSNDEKKELIEVKPYSLKSEKNNLLKKEAAEKWANENGYEYFIVTEIDVESMLNAMILSGHMSHFLFEFCKKYPKMVKEEIKKNKNLTHLSVKKEKNYSDFMGVKRVKAETGLTIEFEDGSSLTCTFGHKLKLINGFMEACDIREGDMVSGKKVISIKETNENIYYYDLLGVDGGEYETNGVISHNCAFLENWDEFYSSVYPTISSGKETKILLTSTPRGLNHFHKMCSGAMEISYEAKEQGSNIGKNGFIYIEVKWDRIPGRDDKWREETLASMGWNYDQFSQEFECVASDTEIELYDTHSREYFTTTIQHAYDNLLTSPKSFKQRKTIVYKLTRNDNKDYIGITVDFGKRLKQHYKSERFSIGIKDYEILFVCDTYEEAGILEEFYIKKYNTVVNGLNISINGKGNHCSEKFTTKNFKYKDSSKKLMSNKAKERYASGNNKLKNRVVSDDEKKKHSDFRKGKYNKIRVINNKTANQIIDDLENLNLIFSDDLIKSIVRKSDVWKVGKVDYNFLKCKNGLFVTYKILLKEFYSRRLGVTKEAIDQVIKVGRDYANTIEY